MRDAEAEAGGVGGEEAGEESGFAAAAGAGDDYGLGAGDGSHGFGGEGAVGAVVTEAVSDGLEKARGEVVRAHSRHCLGVCFARLVVLWRGVGMWSGSERVAELGWGVEDSNAFPFLFSPFT